MFFLSYCISVACAEITNTAGLLYSSKPDAYVELTIDGQPARKTDFVKKSSSPKWEDVFTV